ncbi:MAG TPA: galactose-1-phosphate uridylyltransferase [Clostridia bacterium]|nr:galactose-1-phosphate uridylyltransferase [Clostridia bacterium]
MPELRKDPVIGRWVIIATERALRPSNFRTDKEEHLTDLSQCPFEPGNEASTPPEILSYRRSDSRPNEPGWWVRVIPNKFPALRIEGTMDKHGDGMYDMMNGIGAHEIVIETPNHDEEMAEMPEAQVKEVLWAWRDRIVDLARDRRFKYVMVFKNKGALAGASLQHPHSQIIALPIVPLRVQEELTGAAQYYEYKDRCVFCDIIQQELSDRKRIVEDSERFIAVVPFAQRFPFETWILPKQHESDYSRATRTDFLELAGLLKRTLQRLSRALDDPPFNLVLHMAPLNTEGLPYYHWHLEIMPRVTRTAGFEWGTGFYINPTKPEETAQFLREVQL